MLRPNRVFVIGFICILVATAGGMAVGAAQSDSGNTVETSENFVTVQTTYPTEGPSEAVQVVVRIAPEDETINDVYLNVSNADTGYVDFESFSISITPSGAAEVDEQLEFRSGNRVQSYYISELNSGEVVEISFTAYPTNINTGERSVATVSYQYLQNAQEVPENPPGRIRATTSFAASPYATIDTLQTKVDGMWATTALGVLVGIVALVVGGYFAYKYKNETNGDSPTGSSELRRDLIEAKRELENVASTDQLSPSTRAEIREAIEDAIDALR